MNYEKNWIPACAGMTNPNTGFIKDEQG
jgi:hypothetical protein